MKGDTITTLQPSLSNELLVLLLVPRIKLKQFEIASLKYYAGLDFKKIKTQADDRRISFQKAVMKEA